MTLAEEDYIKAIYQLEMQQTGRILTNDIARKLNTKASSVSDMLKRLEKKGFIHYQKYQGVSLNENGKMKAVKLVRKHRLWETFLVKTLEFGWDEVHDIAEQLEHIQSDKLIDRLNQFLGTPAFDPHGEPIPLEKGNVWETKSQKLSEVPDGTEYVLEGVGHPTDSFLKYLNKIHLQIGTLFLLKNTEPFDRSAEIEVAGQSYFLSHETAQNLKVRKHEH